MSVIQSRTRAEIRESIGRALGAIFGTATGGGDTASLIDTYGLQGGDDEHNGKMVYMTKVAGVAATDKTWVTDYASSTHDATLSPVVSGTVAAGDNYEMYPRPFTVDDINEVIERAAIEVARKNLKVKQTTGNFTLSNISEYAWLSNFVGLHTVEYVSNIQIEHAIHMCEAVWDELVDGDVTASLDTSFKAEGSGCLKLVVAAGCGAGDILATDDITSLDISDCDQLEVFIRSTVALDAGDLQILLDNTASCASPVESLNIPATSANTETWHVISLANPTSDTAIISVGVKMITDKGAFTLYVDGIRAVKSTSRVYKELNPQHWELVKGSTNYLKILPSGLSVTGTNNQIRLNGYQLPAIMTADSDTSDVDPEYIVEYALAYLSLYHAKARSLDIDNREDFGKLHLAMAEKKKNTMSLNFEPNTRFL